MVYIMMGTGFEETELVVTWDLLRRADIPVKLVGLNGVSVKGAHQMEICADIGPEEMDLEAMEMIVLPGGLDGVKNIAASLPAMRAVSFAAAQGRWIAAICAAPTVLAKLHLTDGKTATCYPGMEQQMGDAKIAAAPGVYCDGRLITGSAPGSAMQFGLTLIEALRGEAAAKAAAAGFVYPWVQCK